MKKKYQSVEEMLNALVLSKSELILVEGIPGSGKTTTANRIKEKLEALGKKVVLYTEGMLHPGDMAWHAYLTMEQYEAFKLKFKTVWENSDNSLTLEELYKIIDDQVRFEEEHAILAYTKIEFPEEKYWEVAKDFANYELYDGRSSLEDFTSIHMKRWSKFANEKASDTVVIFECVFLQNHIFELMACYQKSDQEIVLYLENLLHTVEKLNPALIYLDPVKIDLIVRKVAEERKAPKESFGKDWIDEVIEWVENSNYGKSHGLIGYDGVIRFYEEKLRLDHLSMNHLKIETAIVCRK